MLLPDAISRGLPMEDDSRYKPNAFAARHGLKFVGGIGSGFYNLDPFLPNGTTEETILAAFEPPNRFDVLASLEYTLFDHGTRFKAAGQRGAPKIAAIVTSPYASTMVRGYGSEEAAQNAAHQIAGALGLGVRIGHEIDRVYFVDAYTVPILWWNPAVTSFPLLRA